MPHSTMSLARTLSNSALFGAAFLGVLCSSSVASADVSSWYSLAGGVSYIDQGAAATPSTLASPLLDLDLGIGIDPLSPVVVGALFHLGSQFRIGADVGGALRVCTGGYARGEWGIGLDLGSHYRIADVDGAAGFGRVVLGGPWGLVLHLGGSYGEENVSTMSASFGIDMARFSVHRTRGTDKLPSPLSSPDPRDLPESPAAFSF